MVVVVQRLLINKTTFMPLIR